MTLAVTPIYAALLALLYVWLSARVIAGRYKFKASLGDAGEAEMVTRIRGHANLAEYAPMGLILLLLVELQGAPAIAVHALGLMLLAGRTLHALAFLGTTPDHRLRGPGMVLTFAMLVFSALGLLGHALL
ncbi:MAPEG family protein [Seohaeicola zhoushanensis]|uniref:Glutathione S-transferase n=1 Tax=Seohaeicola zhoushanensis TaxID=1569283 RepID=A0A8J3GWE2_9RHOB|nr:MAPEG family protein [Seohaeicola zhoushanensis]GHF44276.1 hypothetical protein GCM10017056_15280 [Seohaeicola zhoushanensis]